MKIRITKADFMDNMIGLYKGDVHEVLATFHDEEACVGSLIKPRNNIEGLMVEEYDVVEEGKCPHIEGEENIRAFIEKG